MGSVKNEILQLRVVFAVSPMCHVDANLFKSKCFEEL